MPPALRNYYTTLHRLGAQSIQEHSLIPFVFIYNAQMDRSFRQVFLSYLIAEVRRLRALEDPSRAEGEWLEEIREVVANNHLYELYDTVLTREEDLPYYVEAVQANPNDPNFDPESLLVALGYEADFGLIKDFAEEYSLPPLPFSFLLQERILSPSIAQSKERQLLFLQELLEGYPEEEISSVLNEETRAEILHLLPEAQEFL